MPKKLPPIRPGQVLKSVLDDADLSANAALGMLEVPPYGSTIIPAMVTSLLRSQVRSYLSVVAS
jgi:hypothetical protein